jgi:tetratricopeptide (TPR) repeat protein
MSGPKNDRWALARRFRRSAFGWRSHPAILRIREALSEIKKAARTDPVLGAEGAVVFLERISAAIASVDGSSGAIGAAVNTAVDVLASIIARAPADEALRGRWLDRLWAAVESDDYSYIDELPDRWGELCASPDTASRWADSFIGTVRMSWGKDRQLAGFFKGSAACLSALYAAGRFEEILELVGSAPYKSWTYRSWGVKALVAMGRKAEALRYAEDSRGLNDSPFFIAEACEEILLSMGRREEAYRRYSMEANRKMTYLATFRAVAAKYPELAPRDILRDLVASTPGEEGKWFAAARSAGLLEKAAELAKCSPCDPKTLIRAARDHAATEPWFALEAGLAALRWIAEGYGYEITGMDVREAYGQTIRAAEIVGRRDSALSRIYKLAEKDTEGGRFLASILRPM